MHRLPRSAGVEPQGRQYLAVWQETQMQVADTVDLQVVRLVYHNPISHVHTLCANIHQIHSIDKLALIKQQQIHHTYKEKRTSHHNKPQTT
jgi:hypothetical protein